MIAGVTAAQFSSVAPAAEPPGRDLTEPELRALVRDFAAAPERWAHLVEHDPDQRRYELLVRDDHVAVWLICWMEDHDTGFHDHDVAAGADAVGAGGGREEGCVPAGGPPDRGCGGGESFSFAGSDIHRGPHAGGEPAVTIHAY